MTGAESNVQFQGGGLPPSPVTGLVNIMIGGVPRLIPFLLGGGNPTGTTADSKSALGAQVPPITISGKRHRTFWYRQHDK